MRSLPQRTNLHLPTRPRARPRRGKLYTADRGDRERECGTGSGFGHWNGFDCDNSFGNDKVSSDKG